MATARLAITITENSYSIANNTSSVTVSVVYYGNGVSWSNYNCPVTLTFNGTTYSGTSRFTTSTSAQTLMAKTVTVAHNSDGTKSVSASATFATGVSIGTLSASASKTLTTIPRYPDVTQSVSSKTETTITMKWSSSSTIDRVWYSTNGGSTWVLVGSVNSTSGTYTISGLSANTTYSIKTRLRRKDSQLTADSAASSIATYAYPYCSAAPAFTVGDAAVLTLYNPLSRSVTVNATAAGGGSILSTTTSGTSATIPASSASTLYASIPNASSGTYTVTVTYSGHSATMTGTYRVGASAGPSVSGGTYADENSSVTAITGDDQKIIPSKSSLTFTATGLLAQNSATISSVTVTLGASTYAMTVSGSTATRSGVVLTDLSLTEAVLTVTDSRGLTATKSISLDVVDYSPPTVSARATRQSGYYSSTTVSVTTNYTIIGSNSVVVQLQGTKSGDSSPSVTQTLSSGDNTVVFDNEYAWTIVLEITDSFGSSSTFSFALGKGVPLLYFDTEKNSISVEKFPTANGIVDIGLDLSVDGEATFNGAVTLGQDPANAMEAVTKQYVDTRGASPSNVTVGDSDGATWTATGSGIVTIVGRAYATGAYVFVYDETAGTYVLMIQKTTSSYYGSASFWATKGHVYTTALANWNTITRFFYKLFD